MPKANGPKKHIIKVEDTDAILVLTEWKEYAKIDWSVISKDEETSLVFDARSIVSKEKALSQILTFENW